MPNFPNPFNPETWIPFTLGEEAEVRLSVYAADGSLVRKIDLGRLTPGFYTDRRRAAYWDGRNALGEPVASGAYFVIFQAGSVTQTRRLLLMK
ncbi:MAG: hypothetical protein KatS3mg115_1100 [Candidatus Poribacteria bacterium]|nr:MAG: hypothetical protein KatS3mg115_1100 [Candidatus Poribacteria bacterium]